MRRPQEGASIIKLREGTAVDLIPALDKGTGETVEDDCQDYDTDASLKAKTRSFYKRQPL
ncbi:hypothetical protein [Pelotomaculum sp. FP]|uniref:hypothetical protein n=1 Tax=Pelotomaculum sp. FP TaxID=261474 RepID=UPI0010661CA6|nr:hypothetical protein [Pelotomaculum sp. FP]